MKTIVFERAAELAADAGPSVDHALDLFERAGGCSGGHVAQVWLSVAFLFARHARVTEMLRL